MQKEMKKAAVGHRQSMEQLYNETKNHVSYLIYCILLDEKQTENAMVFIYESLWRDGQRVMKERQNFQNKQNRK